LRRLDFDEITKQLLELLLQELPMQAFFDEVYKLVRLPMNYFDTSFRLIANAFERPFYFDKWRKMDENGTFPDEEIASQNYLWYQEKMYRSKRSSIFDYGTTEGYPQACGPVTVDGRLVGYMGTMIEDAERDDVLRFNDIMTEAIVVLTRKQMKTASAAPGGFPEDMLLQDSIPAASRRLFAETYPAPYVYVLISRETESASTLLYIQKHLSESLKPVLSCLNGECYLHVLVAGAESARTLSQLSQTLERYELTAGVSDWFNDLSNLKTRRIQAYMALAVGYDRRRGERLLLFRDCLFDVVSQCISERGLSTYILPEIKTLIQTDRETGSSYIETLSCYADCRNSSSECAKRLGLHTNTVLGRLKKVEELTGLSLHDTQKSESVALQLKLLKSACTRDEIMREEEKWTR
jgi:hypothetical protein